MSAPNPAALAALRAPAPVPDRGCEFSGPSSDGTCARTAVIVATGGCIHEHVVRDLPVCQYHTEEVAAGDSYCRPCFEADGHDCPIAFDPRSVRDLEAARLEVFAVEQQVGGGRD